MTEPTTPDQPDTHDPDAPDELHPEGDTGVAEDQDGGEHADVATEDEDDDEGGPDEADPE